MKLIINFCPLNREFPLNQDTLNTKLHNPYYIHTYLCTTVTCGSKVSKEYRNQKELQKKCIRVTYRCVMNTM